MFFAILFILNVGVLTGYIAMNIARFAGLA